MKAQHKTIKITDMPKPDVYSLLKKKYPESEYALMAEVSDASGFNRSRSADYISVSLWPSRGHAITGIELKSFRSDWLNEKKNPKKAENIFQYCHRWYLLTTDDTIAKIDEIPLTWGWLCIKGSRIITMKEAPLLTPILPTMSFFCAMLKRAASKENFVHIDSIADKIEETRESALSAQSYREKGMQAELNNLKDAIAKFELHSGVSLRNKWELQKIGEAVRFVMDGGVDGVNEKLLSLETTAQKTLASIQQSLAGLKEEKK